MTFDSGNRVAIKDEVFEGEGIVVKKVHVKQHNTFVAGTFVTTPEHDEYLVKITKIKKHYINPLSVVAAVGGGYVRKGDERIYQIGEMKKLKEVI